MGEVTQLHPAPSHWTDWVSGFMGLTEGITAPEIYRQWCGIAAVAGALERRVWAITSKKQLFPNLYTLLVGPPGVGKTVSIDYVRDLWYAARIPPNTRFRIAPDSLTKAALVDSLAAADRKIVTPTGLVEYHSLLVVSAELGVLVSAHDLEFLSVLNYIYDNQRHYIEKRRTLNKEINIIFPQLNILAGSQPGFLASLLPEEAWSMGTTARLIMIYASQAPTVDIFAKIDEEVVYQDDPRFKALALALGHIGTLMGKMAWTPEAQAELQAWETAGRKPVPVHSKLQHYSSRRLLYVLKLSMISAVSRSGELLITLEDVERARTWLIQAETLMPDIFKEMVGRSDSQVIQELHFYIWRLWVKEKKPIHEARIYSFLKDRMPSEKIPRLIDVAMRANIITGAGERLYIPRARHEHGLE